ncbi:MAG: ATP-binding protein [Bacteroidota bacterium]
MDALLNQIFSFLTGQPGNVFYHYALVLSIGIALYSAFNNWRSSEFPQARRTILGLSILLLAQFLMFGFSALGWQGMINTTASLPPLDRAFTLLSIVIIVWLWGFPEPSRVADWATVLLVILIAVASVLALLTWGPRSTLTTYNLTPDELAWQAASLAFLALGMIVLLARRPNGFANGLVMLLLAFLGHAAHLFFLTDSNYSGIVRLAYMAAFPILVTLPQRFPAPVEASERTNDKPVTDKSAGAERRRYSADPKTFHSMLAVAAESGPLEVSQALARAIAQSMLADLCFLMYLGNDRNQLLMAGGYDLIREDHVEGGPLDRSIVPMLTSALQRGRPLRLPASSTSADIKGLGEVLGLANPGHLLSVPIVTPEKEVLGGVMLLSPYSNRLWTAEDQAFLANIASSLVPVIQRSQKVKRLEQQSEQTRQALEMARGHIEELESRNAELDQQMQGTKLPSDTEAALLTAQAESQRLIAQLQQENAELRLSSNGRNLHEAGAPDTELKAAIEEAAHLRDQLAEASRRLAEVQKGGAGPRSREQAEVIASISQELRQPLSSLIGYTDLLLGESVGILGAMQRKFVERIKASTERIGSLIQDMIQINTIETGAAAPKPELIDLNHLIDNAMSYTGSQVREKNISLHLDLPKKLAPVEGDREALQQILVHLLQNAASATPVEGTIRLKVETRREEGQDFILLQVTDSGGGIPPQDLPRVFSRLYRADNVLIQGIGDTGVGLSIARTLAEAQQGRIWVDSEPGQGSTFSVLLPITPAQPADAASAEKGKK